MSDECDKCGEHALECRCSKYRFWNDGALKIRTCIECKISQFKSPDDGQWILYFTQERTQWYFDQIFKENNPSAHCKICSGVDKPKKYKVPVCNWCEKCEIVRECGPNYICQKCEILERKVGRPLVFTSPVSDAYFLITNSMSDKHPLSDPKNLV